MEKKSLWSFGTREVVYSAIGAALYAVLSVRPTSCRSRPRRMCSIRPAVAIPMFFGVAFGPWVGFITGLLGNVISDLISGYGFWPWWDLGNGLMGFIPGLIWLGIKTFRSGGDIVKAEIMVVVGAAVGMFVASVSEIWVSGIDFATTMATNFMPAFISNVINGLILVPILMVAYAAIRGRSGR